MKLLITFLALVCLAKDVVALTPAQWRSQSIYQLLTDRFSRTDGSTTASCNLNDYCGGSWQGVINKLDYIQQMGFTAIWISPVVENLPQSTSDGEAYHGYWAQNVYEINTNFGSASDLRALSEALHSRGMYLMVDVVTNHLGYTGCGTCVDYSVFYPFNSQSYFHPYCPINYNNQTSVEVCWEGDNIVALADLRTEDSNVLSMWQTWIEQLVSNYTIDGLRIDSCAEVDQAFFPPFVQTAGVYAVGEVDNGNPSYVCPYQNYIPGVLNYPAYYWITQAFESTSGSISNLVNGINTMKSDCADTTLLGSFMENHDNPRFPSETSDISLAKNAIAFTMLSDGIPIIYYGQEQHFSGGAVPNDREALWLSGYPTTSAPLYTYIAQLNALRSRAIAQSSSYLTYKAVVGYSDSSTIVMRKGATNSQIVGVFSNKGANGNSYTLTLSSSATGFTSNQAVLEILSCQSYTTDGSGNLAVSMAGGLPRVFYPQAQLSGSSICSTTSKSATTLTTVKSTSTASTTKPSSCAVSSAAVTFDLTETTTYGEQVYITGNITSLGDWSTSSGVALSASQYTSSDPLWDVTINFTPGTAFQYKYYKKETSGSITWEGGSNRQYVVGCTSSATQKDTWQS